MIAFQIEHGGNFYVCDVCDGNAVGLGRYGRDDVSVYYGELANGNPNRVGTCIALDGSTVDGAPDGLVFKTDAGEGQSPKMYNVRPGPIKLPADGGNFGVNLDLMPVFRARIVTA